MQFLKCFAGSSLTSEIPTGTTACKNLLEINDRASSVKTDGCVKLYEHADCFGKRVQISSPGVDKLEKLGFDNMMSSISGCQYGPGPSGKNIQNIQKYL